MSRLENLNRVYKVIKEFDCFTHEVYGESPDTCFRKSKK